MVVESMDARQVGLSSLLTGRWMRSSDCVFFFFFFFTSAADQQITYR